DALDGDNWNMNCEFNYFVEIDTKEGLVQKFDYFFGFEINIGSNNTKLEMGYAFNIIKDKESVWLPFSFSQPLLAITMILMIYTIHKRKNSENL
ncbi:MAG: hypothetical protein ACTSPI_09730, partial [Candidatus Heimdallarchaeaceae archaeon]